MICLHIYLSERTINVAVVINMFNWNSVSHYGKREKQ